MIYVLDTSAVIDGRIRYYPPEVFPGLWQRIEDLVVQERLISSEEVLLELEKVEDDAFAWAIDHPAMFLAIDAEIQVAVTNILGRHPRLVNAQKSRSMADPWVIALASIKQGTVVTGEHRSGNLSRPKIPDVCNHEQIPYVDFIGMIRREKWVF